MAACECVGVKLILFIDLKKMLFQEEGKAQSVNISVLCETWKLFATKEKTTANSLGCLTLQGEIIVEQLSASQPPLQLQTVY